MKATTPWSIIIAEFSIPPLLSLSALRIFHASIEFPSFLMVTSLPPLSYNVNFVIFLLNSPLKLGHVLGIWYIQCPAAPLITKIIDNFLLYSVLASTLVYKNI